MFPPRSAVGVRVIPFRVPPDGLCRNLWCGEQMGIYFKAAGIVAGLVLVVMLWVALTVGACQISPIFAVMLQGLIMAFALFGMLVKLQNDFGEF